MFKKIFKTFYYVLLGGLAIIALLLVFSRFPIAGKLQTLMVLSGSMEPKIKTGSVVLVKGASTYKTGDVVTFKGEGKTPTTHRIVAETDEGYVTRGDANNADDLAKTKPQNILGKVLLSIPYLGYLLAWIKTTPGLIITIIIPAVIIIYSEALVIQKETKKMLARRLVRQNFNGGGSLGEGGLARRKKKNTKSPAMRTNNSKMPLPKIKQAMVKPLAMQTTKKQKIKETAKKTVKIMVLLFGFLSILNLRQIQGTQAFFTDEEKSSGTITAWVDAPAPAPGDVVINEFLPKPEGTEYGFNFGDDSSDMPRGEWVELYNNSDNPFDLAGWYIRDESATNKIMITAANTYPAGTVINGKSWLVVYMNKAVLNNTGDTVKLFDGADNLVDLYAYTTTNDYCDLQPTPDASNTTSPSGACSGVPPNKSYARIPDGSANWVDPIPTPGKPNILGDENNQTTAPQKPENDILSSPLQEILGASDSAPITNTEATANSTPSQTNTVVSDSTPATDIAETESPDNLPPTTEEEKTETNPEEASPAPLPPDQNQAEDNSADNPDPVLNSDPASQPKNSQEAENPTLNNNPPNNNQEGNNDPESAIAPPEALEEETAASEPENSEEIITIIEEAPSPPDNPSPPPLENLNHS